MNIFNDLVLKFEKSDRSKNPEFGMIDTILEVHPEIYGISNSTLLVMNMITILDVVTHLLLSRSSGQLFINR